MDNLLNLIELRSARRARVHEALLEILEESSRRSPRFRSFPGNNSQRWYNIMVPQMDDEEFRKHFRMGRGTFTYIVEKVRPCLEREMTRFQDSLCVEKIVAIGDSAFRLSSWLIKPYSASDDDDKTYFNSKHTLARRTIECTFGRCKGRWRRLLYCLHLDIANVPSVVNAAFVLNNICEEYSEPMDSNWTRQAIELEDSFGSGFNSNSIRGREPETDGQQIRNALMNFLISHQ
ncbi:hypothetical protein BLOT_015645 [Blomia tropicalis]|nr:hypothetical protein BLOT_015645 [Blomia tropicalis]